MDFCYLEVSRGFMPCRHLRPTSGQVHSHITWPKALAFAKSLRKPVIRQSWTTVRTPGKVESFHMREEALQQAGFEPRAVRDPLITSGTPHCFDHWGPSHWVKQVHLHETLHLYILCGSMFTMLNQGAK